MRRFLVVGCGGSGGSTLQFVMDQLLNDLAAVGITKLPTGWQFVHIDVPGVADSTGRGMPPSVAQSGGRYVSIGSQTAAYPDIAIDVDARLRGNKALASAAGWAPNPAEVNIPVDKGAGQHRAIGRYLTLSKLSNVQTGLARSFGTLSTPGATHSLASLADIVSKSTADEVDSTSPVVLVVSSMAGGSGASMVLDVCRLLSTVQGINPSSIILMVYTAEVFSEIPSDQRSGIEANSVAMLGELVAAQTGSASADDSALFGALGVDAPADGKAPFRRVVPIGSRIGGDGAPFGDGTMRSVYRGVGRGIAALMLSGVAMNQYLKAVGENSLGGGDLNVTNFGWDVKPDDLVWASFGFASVGLGRDRYGEYAAQRLARRCVDRLVRGHLQDDGRTAQDTMSSLVQGIWPRFANDVGVPQTAATDVVSQWLGTTLGGVPGETGRTLTTETLRQFTTNRPPAPLPDVLKSIIAPAEAARRSWESAIQERAYAWTFEWSAGVEQRLREQLVTYTALHGLATATALLDELADRCGRWVEAMRTMRKSSAELDAVLAKGRESLNAKFPKGKVEPSHPAVVGLLGDYSRGVTRSFGAKVIELLVELIPTMVSGLVAPLAEAARNAQGALEIAMQPIGAARTVTMIRTDDYSQWPAEGTASLGRFRAAQNERLLTDPDSFTAYFKDHVIATAGENSVETAINKVVTTLLAGEWASAGADAGSFQTIITELDWRSAVFPHNPGSTGDLIPERTSRHSFALRPADILDRSRRFIERPDEPFHRFISASLRSYLGERLPDAEKLKRQEEVLNGLLEAIKMSKPLVAVNPQTVQRVHHRSVTTFHSFTAIPFGDGPLADRLRDIIGSDSSLDQPHTVTAFDSATAGAATSAATRIDVFGTYPCYSPVVFTSLLAPAWTRWHGATDAGRASFWQWRRGRRLAGAVPVNPNERFALISGWWVARLLGVLRYPGEQRSQHVSVRAADGEWLSFPDEMPHSTARDTHPLDRLPAVLEALPLAVAACHNKPELEPLHAYRTLRGYFDDNVRQSTLAGERIWTSQTGQLSKLAAKRHFEDWIRKADAPSSNVPEPRFVGAVDSTPADRKKAVLQTLNGLADAMSAFLPTHLGGNAASSFSDLKDTDMLWKVPLTHEIAGEIRESAEFLAAMVTDISTDPMAGPSGIDGL